MKKFATAAVAVVLAAVSISAAAYYCSTVCYDTTTGRHCYRVCR